MKAFHGWSVLFWVCSGLAATIHAQFFKPNPDLSISILVFVSFYANAAAEFSSWHAASAESKANHTTNTKTPPRDADS